MIGLSRSKTSGAAAVVTGAGSGIGRAFAVELARRGARVVCSDINQDSAQATVALVEAAGGTGLPVPCDVGSSENVAALRDRSLEWFDGAPTLLINNAGIGAGGHSVGRSSLADWERTLQINLWGVIYGCHHFLPVMKQAGRGGVINVASAAGFAAGPRMAAYNVSKAGVMSLSETLAAELAGTGLRVTMLCPTFVKTNIFSGELIEASAAGTASRIAGFMGMSPEKVARMTLDGHDRGRLYVVPQLDARAIWLAKRLTPTSHARVGGLLGRLAPFPPEEEGIR
ncbi:putative short-chain dehydrogenase/reductase [Nocardioides phosphati]|jgi:short-subunit dehydrogenase|uniref:Short-chain dehydrogenase/reductase n=1 Tax=Nocardioides phosphati TaxID=1867775 RepID=A0ABQ2NDY4_9ACTN|nr:SDR family NAD(P)-dependent oxidoreductase [Nocardioides phosphati]GGO94320.1 putative short-chain dehydrogenase/reductase [Nocardioides phosphati]